MQQQGAGERDLALHAQTRLLMAQLDVHDSRMTHAQIHGVQALAAFQQLGDALGAAEALCVESYSASALGRPARAAKAARECADLHASTRWLHTRALGLNYLGVAAFWQGDHVGSCNALDAARDAVLVHSPRDAQAFQPHVNAAFNNFLSLAAQRDQGTGHADAGPFLQSVATARRLALCGDISGLTRGAHDIGLTLLTFLCAQASLLTGDEQDAQLYAEACRRRTARLASTSWLHALPHWWHHDLALQRGDHRAAGMAAWGLRQAARLGEHQPLAELGDRLLAACRRP
jgi:hypothetical protein